MPHYVVLHHRVLAGKALPRGAHDHFDWMFENGDSLLTWATDSLPSRTSGSTMRAILLPAHRTIYLTFQGPLSEDRGEVERVESGTFETIQINETQYEFAVKGDRVGIILLRKNHRGGDATWDWSFRMMRADAS